MKAIIMAGGKGTRLKSVTGDEIPKPLALVNGKPILQWQIECLKANGITEILIVVGYLGEKIKAYFGEKYQYFTEETPLGTAGALSFLSDFIGDDDFFLVFGDTVFDIDLKYMHDYHKSKSAKATLFAHPNSHPYDSDLIIVNADDKVLRFDSKSNIRNYWYENLVNAGLYVLSPSVLDTIKCSEKTDLEKQVLSKMSDVCAYRSSEYIKDAGTPERIKAIENDLKTGVVSAKNRKTKQICVFLDRDGTINKYKGLIYKPEDIELEDVAAEAIKALNQSKFLTAIVTNQPSIARGLCNIEDIVECNKKLVTTLGEKGAYVDDFEFCPHHPDSGYPEENPIFKVKCSCRKPNIGMIHKIAERHNVDLSKSWIIGDTTRDIQTGINAGMSTILVKTGEAGNDGAFEVTPDFTFDNLLQAIEEPLNFYKS
ncbi:hypothetical protein FACS18949_11640 [Clostridia bacterium]|nr:hypothetical protein FACS18949_11640 [Clostridia bacterium]